MRVANENVECVHNGLLFNYKKEHEMMTFAEK